MDWSLHGQVLNEWAEGEHSHTLSTSNEAVVYVLFRCMVACLRYGTC